jgi:general secretion pathway protein C
VRKDGIMSQNSKKKALSIFVPLLAGLFISKALWVGVDYKFLPKEGVDKEYKSDLKPLYYRYALATKKEVKKPVVKKKPKVKKVVKRPKPKPKPKPLKIKKFKLKGIIYENPQKGIATIEYLGKSFVLELGEKLEGFELVGFEPTGIIFQKNGKKYKLDLFSKKADKKHRVKRVSYKARSSNKVAPKKKENKPKAVHKDIQQDGDVTVISKNLFNKYRKDLGAIRRNIGVSAYTENNKLKGFKVRYIKKGSDFDRVGVKTGDIITAINGEEITDLSVPIRFFNNIDTITNATITIKRGNEEKELEYEVR